MTVEELQDVTREYQTFNSLLFNNQLPKKEEILFSLTDTKGCLGFSRYIENPILGCNHEISFNMEHLYTKELMRSILIHEMIHLWQETNVDLDRYKVCSQLIAHDRVFTCKMQTINILLKKFGYDGVELSCVYDGPKLEKDRRREK